MPRALLLFALAATFSASAQTSPAVFPLDETPPTRPALSQQEPRVAKGFTAGEFLVAWTRIMISSSDVHLTRVRMSGGQVTVVDPLGIPLVTTTAAESAPELACDATGCIVLWREGSAEPYIVRAMRFTLSGGVVTPNPEGIKTVTLKGNGYAVAAKQTGGFVIAYSELVTTNYQPRFLSPTDWTPVNAVSAAGVDDAIEALACGETACVALTTVVSSSARRVNLLALALSNGVITRVSTTTSQDNFGGSLAWAPGTNGGRFAVAYFDATTNPIKAMAFTVDGNGFNGTTPLALADAGTSSEATVAWSGSAFDVFWRDGEDLAHRSVTSAGTAGGFAIPFSELLGAQAQPRALYVGSEALLVFTDNARGPTSISALRVLAPSSLGYKISITAPPIEQLGARAVFDGTNYGVVWTEHEGTLNTWSVVMRRFTPAGVAVDRAPLVLAAYRGSNPMPRITACRGGYLVLWHNSDTDLGLGLVAPTYPLSSLTQLVPAQQSTTHDVACMGGDTALVTYSFYETSGGSNVHRMVVFRQTSATSDTKSDWIVPSSARVVAASSGGSGAVMWNEGASLRIVTANSVNDPLDERVHAPSSGFSGHTLAGGDGFALAWSEPATGARDITGARLRPDAGFGAAIKLTTGPADDSQAQLVWSGTEWALLFRRVEGLSDSILGVSAGDLRSAPSTLPVPLAASDDPERDGFVACASSSNALFAWSRDMSDGGVPYAPAFGFIVQGNVLPGDGGQVPRPDGGNDKDAGEVIDAGGRAATVDVQFVPADVRSVGSDVKVTIDLEDVGAVPADALHLELELSNLSVREVTSAGTPLTLTSDGRHELLVPKAREKQRVEVTGNITGAAGEKVALTARVFTTDGVPLSSDRDELQSEAIALFGGCGCEGTGGLSLIALWAAALARRRRSRGAG